MVPVKRFELPTRALRRVAFPWYCSSLHFRMLSNLQVNIKDLAADCQTYVGAQLSICVPDAGGEIRSRLNFCGAQGQVALGPMSRC